MYLYTLTLTPIEVILDVIQKVWIESDREYAIYWLHIMTCIATFWAILDDRKSLSIAFLAISDQYATLFFIFFKMAASGHFGSPICVKNNRVLPLCVINGYAKYEVDRWICDTVREATSFLSIFIQNGRQRPFCFSDWWQNHRVLVIWDLNGYGEYEFDRCICDKSYGLYKRWRAAAAQPKT